MKPVIGVVVSNKMQKSVVVAVDRLFHHKLYNTLYQKNQLDPSRPISKRKCWTVEILKKAQIYVAPPVDPSTKNVKPTADSVASQG
ncbi:hypothetical protein MKW92_034712 [Papaver armeniacum]|nr:hypothetical protein MKW92_034712 [Papaver armeniacum]